LSKGLSPSLPNPASVTSDDKRTYRGIQEGIHPSPVVQLNRAVAIAMCDGPGAGLTHIDALLEQGELANYYLAHSARADMYLKLGRTAEARSAYEKALALTQQEPERHFLQERIRQLK
jgi:RNA polymerase sigma-70 factor (ECF subfamily)